MGRLLAIDYGRRRCGIAVTDSLRIVATALETLPTQQLFDFLRKYLASNEVDYIVMGKPTDMAGRPSESMRYIEPAVARLRKEFPQTPVYFYDERFTSTIAHRSMIDSGMTRTQRRNREAVDRMAATIILNDFLQSKFYQTLP
ncbi:MAG: Holliday junction resolvase RuvX [Muribaculaceae bacterium]|nr:Holliday junction resolvase RuvX [Muribaculaceae bacterium]